jgi:hypothetical protein
MGRSVRESAGGTVGPTSRNFGITPQEGAVAIKILQPNMGDISGYQPYPRTGKLLMRKRRRLGVLPIALAASSAVFGIAALISLGGGNTPSGAIALVLALMAAWSCGYFTRHPDG